MPQPDEPTSNHAALQDEQATPLSNVPNDTSALPPPNRRSSLTIGLVLALIVVAILVVGAVSAHSQMSDSNAALSVPPNVTVAQYSHYADRQGILHYVGEVKNNGAAAVDHLNVTIALFDAKGIQVGVASDNILSDMTIAPQQLAGFSIAMNPPARWSQDKASVSAETSGFNSFDPIRDASNLSISGDSLTSTSDGELVSGQVHNGDSANCQPAHVVVTGYDSSGKVVDVADAYTSDTTGILSGQSQPFAVTMPRGVKISKYSIALHAYQKSLSCTGPPVAKESDCRQRRICGNIAAMLALRQAVVRRNSQFKIQPSQLLLVLALLLGLGLRLAFVLHGQAIGGSPLILDEGNYVGSALPLAQGHDIPDRWLWERPPLYIFFAAALFAVFGSGGAGNLLALGLAQVALGLLAIWLVWLISRLLFPARPLAAALAALLVALCPPLAFYANMDMTEALYIPLFLAWFYATLRWQAVEGGINPTTTLTAVSTQNPKPKTQNYYLVLSAVTFAGAALTRSLMLFFLPALLGWLIWRARARLRRALAQSAIYIAIILALILPWSIRNLVHYGHFILIDTTGQINLYIDNGTLSRSDAYDRLGQIANLGERADFAQSQAVTAILADPGRFVGSAVGRLQNTWRSDPFTEFQAFLSSKYPSTAGTWELIYALAGGFYHLLFFTLAITGLALARGEGAAKALALLLIAVHTFTTLLAHPEYRYLLPFMALLAPWGGWALATLFQPRRWAAGWRGPGARVRLALALLAVAWLLYSSAPTFSSAPNKGTAYGAGVKAAYHLARADLAHLFGDTAGEDNQLAAALTNFDAADLWLRRADLSRSAGQLDAATRLYDRALTADRHYWPAALGLGAARRTAGDIAGATSAFDRIEPSFRAGAQDWAWAHLTWDLRPQISVGQADYGYIQGFFAPEQDTTHAYRWSSAAAALHLYTPTSATTITLTLRASSASQRLSVSLNGQQLGSYQQTTDWHELAIPLPPALQAAHDYQVQLGVDARPPSAQDPRNLGVAIAAAAMH